VTQRAFPFDAGAGSSVLESDWALMARHWLGAGVLLDELNGLQVYADSTGMQVKIRTGKAWVGGCFYLNDAEVTLGPIAAANPTNPRIDRVVLDVDWGANTAALAYLTGSADPSPAPPALTFQTVGTRYWLPLAQVRVEAGAVTIAADKITDERPNAIPRLHDLLTGHTVSGLTVGDGLEATAAGAIAFRPRLTAHVTRTGAKPLTPATRTILDFDGDRYKDDATMHSTVTNNSRLVAPVAGRYAIGACIGFDNTSTVGFRLAALKLNNAAYIGEDSKNAVNGYYTYCAPTTTYDLAAGDYVEVEVYQNSGATLNVILAPSESPEFWLSLLRRR